MVAQDVVPLLELRGLRGGLRGGPQGPSTISLEEDKLLASLHRLDGRLLARPTAAPRAHGQHPQGQHPQGQYLQGQQHPQGQDPHGQDPHGQDPYGLAARPHRRAQEPLGVGASMMCCGACARCP